MQGSVKLRWETKPKRVPSEKDIEFQTAEIVFPNPERVKDLPLFKTKPDLFDIGEIDKQKMNRLIWGDNLLAMQALLAQGYEGKINLIYIDPPFGSGRNYNFQTKIEMGDDEYEKEWSSIELLAYTDIWERGLDSYLDFLYPRLHLMKRLLAENGSIYVHCNWHVNSYIRILLDEIFGYENFRNEIVWHYRTYQGQVESYFPRKHDTILFYSKTNKVNFKLLKEKDITKNIDYKRWSKYINEKGEIRGNNYPKTDSRFDVFINKWRRENPGKEPTENDIIYKLEGLTVDSVWDIKPVDPKATERLGFLTQKPDEVLERIILASSNPGDLIADFFCGSGTTMAVIEKLNSENPDKLPRKWLGCDLSKTAIQLTRERLVSIGLTFNNKTKQWEGEPTASPFLIENIGNYQREMIFLQGYRIYEILNVVLKLYGATPRKDFKELGIRKGEDGIDEVVYVSYPDRPVTAKLAVEKAKLVETLDGTGYRRLVILGWDYEYNYQELLRNYLEAKPTKVKIESKMIPPEIYNYLKKIKSDEDIESLRDKVKFLDKPYLKLAKPKIKKHKDYAEVEIEIERYVLFDIPVEKEEDRQKILKLAKNKFEVLIDYWSVDWNYDGVTFRSSWQEISGFGRRKRIVSKVAKATLLLGKKYTIAVRVVDIFGNDSTATIEVDLR